VTRRRSLGPPRLPDIGTLFLYVFVLSLLPTFEGRYALLVGIVGGLNPYASLLSACLGVAALSMVLPFALPYIDGIASWMSSSGSGRLRHVGIAYLTYIYKARSRASPYIGRYGFIGLTLFIAIPVPMTGMWTASVVAFLLGMKKTQCVATLLVGGLAANLITFIPSVLLLG
jgi:uncharacterized membrane protein